MGFRLLRLMGHTNMAIRGKWQPAKPPCFPMKIEVAEEIASLAINEISEIRFQSGFGLEELCAAWPEIPKRILEP